MDEAPGGAQPAPLLFVCSGNTCRSPLAEAIAESLGFPAASAGLWADDGMPATDHAISVAAEAGLDVSGHHSRPLSEPDVGAAAAVYTMTQDHADRIISLWPAHRAKVSRLDPAGDIADPMGHPRDAYVEAFARIDSALKGRLDRT